MPRLLLSVLAALVALGAATDAAAQRKNVILYIGDGYGISPKTAARMALGQGQDGARFSTDPNFRLLAVDRLPYNTTVTTHSLNSWVTDSAPGATVYAAGQAGQGRQRVHRARPGVPRAHRDDPRSGQARRLRRRHRVDGADHARDAGLVREPHLEPRPRRLHRRPVRLDDRGRVPRRVRRELEGPVRRRPRLAAPGAQARREARRHPRRRRPPLPAQHVEQPELPERQHPERRPPRPERGARRQPRRRGRADLGPAVRLRRPRRDREGPRLHLRQQPRRPARGRLRRLREPTTTRRSSACSRPATCRTSRSARSSRPTSPASPT